MPTSPMKRFVQHLRSSVLIREDDGLGDGDLLGSFIERRDEAALAALVKRHGPMVWGVCRRLLSYHDAEDAFQATFIVLVRKAASVVPREMVGNWLYGVANRTALHARRTTSRRKTREIQVTLMPDPHVVEKDDWEEVEPLLDQELRRLPDNYRAVVVLCDLEGRTRKDVALQLCVPEGTVAGRLARARVLLAKRLAQRGVVLPGGALAGLLSQAVASASVPGTVLSSTIDAATVCAAGQAAAAGALSAKVASLTEGVLKAMLMSKLKSAIAVILAIAVLCGATGPVCRTQAGEQPKAEKPAEKDKKADTVEEKKTKSDEEQFQGVWTLVEAGGDGKKEKAEEQNFEAVLTVKRGTLHLKLSEGGNTVIDKFFVYKLDPTTSVKMIDLADWKKGLKEKDGIIEGVYAIDGDTLSLCFGDGAMSGAVNDRPTSLESKEGSKTVTWTLKRNNQDN